MMTNALRIQVVNDFVSISRVLLLITISEKIQKIQIIEKQVKDLC